MRKISNKELKEILEKHRHWLAQDCPGWQDMKADLSDTDLRGKDLSNYVNLSYAYLVGADLSHANLQHISLCHADLSDAKLCHTDLSDANLFKARMMDAQLESATLYGANLTRTDLSNANLNRISTHLGINGMSKPADFSYANLYKATINYACLEYANFSCAYLEKTQFIHSILMYAKFKKTKLPLANFQHAYLEHACFRKADLSEAIICDANCIRATFEWVNLTNAYLNRTSFISAAFNNANLSNAECFYSDFRLAHFQSCNFLDMKTVVSSFETAVFHHSNSNVPYIPLNCPSHGAFIGWKKVKDNSGEYLIKLEIPDDAKRCSSTSRKCRCDKAKVLGIYNLDGSECKRKRIINTAYSKCIYWIGKMVYPDKFDENRLNECSHGIHFFINMKDAIDY